jgi:hypothetical protein
MEDIRQGQDMQPHNGIVSLHHSFSLVYEWLLAKGELTLTTEAGTRFTARSGSTQHGTHAGGKVIRFFQDNTEYGRAYECCWGHYYNCNRARIGMYCKALDSDFSLR